jgi:hypothetical protein
MTGHSNQSLQSPLNETPTGNSNTSFWGLPDLQGAGVSVPIDSQGQFADHQFEGNYSRLFYAEPKEYMLIWIGDSLFNAQDLLVLQDLESFSQNTGLNNEWTLPSEPSIVQILAGESNMHPNHVGIAGYTLQDEPSSQPDQSLSQLPIERESVGGYSIS